jgi:hypothetical protein
MKFFLAFDDENYTINLKGIDSKADLFEDLEFILNNENTLLDKISDYSKNNMSAIVNKDEDLSKKNFSMELDNIKFKDLEKFSQPICEEIIKIFENEFINLIKKDQDLSEMNNIPFNELTEYKRFCHFCLVKKVNKFFSYFFLILI